MENDVYTSTNVSRKRKYKLYLEPHNTDKIPRTTIVSRNREINHNQAGSSLASTSITTNTQIRTERYGRSAIQSLEKTRENRDRAGLESELGLPESDEGDNSVEALTEHNEKEKEVSEVENITRNINVENEHEDQMVENNAPENALSEDSDDENENEDQTVENDVLEPENASSEDSEEENEEKREKPSVSMFLNDNYFDENLTIGRTTTRREAVILIQAYALRHALTQLAIDDMLNLINTLFGSDAVPTTNYRFKKCFAKPKTKKHNLCHTKCFEILDDDLNCPNCFTSYEEDTVPNFFFSMPLAPQIQSLLSHSNFSKKIHYRFYRVKASVNAIDDIYDGEVYKSLTKDGMPLSNENNLSLTFSTDGAAVFKSSKQNIWPLFAMLNELPPKDRFNNVMLVGLWCGRGHPRMDIFLQPFLEELKMMYNIGFTFEKDQKIIKSKVIAICSCPDSVARPLLQNSTQFNGYFGCSWCLHPGHLIKEPEKIKKKDYKQPKSLVRFTESEEVYENRSEKKTLKHMELALVEEKSVKGIKGPSILINLPFFNVIDGFVPDYMHVVLLGVVKTTTEKFLSSYGADYYIGAPKNLAILNSRLTNIKPPSEIVRRPRSLKDRNIWKANEWRNWLLFYSIPCLQDILPKKYLKHFALLSKAVFILLQGSISEIELNVANNYIVKFVYDYQILYGEASMVANVHFLLHLPKSVFNFGPLWAHSAFVFETENGKMVNFVKGTTDVATQICQKYLRRQSFEIFLNNFLNDINNGCKIMLKKLTFKICKQYELTKFMGKPEKRILSNLEKEILDQNSDINYDENKCYEIYKRLRYKGIILHGTSYTRAKRQNNSFISGLVDTGKIYGKIKYFISLDDDLENTLVILEHYDTFPSLLKQPYVKIGVKQLNVLALKLACVREKCIEVNIKNKSFITHLPNIYENTGIM